MALSANSVFEVRTGGSDTNGGGFVTGSGGTDYSQQNSANSVGSNISTTDAHSVGTTTITSATAAFTSVITGNIIYFAGGSGTIAAQWRQATYVSATTITIDTAIATSVGMTMNIGGALASPGQAAVIAQVANQQVYLQAPGTFTLTTSGTGSGGVATSVGGVIWVGYATNRTVNNTDTKPVFSAGAITSANMFGNSGALLAFNIAFDGVNQTSTTIKAAVYIRCSFTRFATAASGGSVYISCSATANSGTPFGGATITFGCEAYANTTTPFQGPAISCLSYNNTGATTDGFAQSASYVNCTAYGNGRAGFRMSAAGGMTCVNCYAEGNTGAGFANASGNTMILINHAAYNNTGGAVSNTGSGSIQQLTTLITPGVSAFVAAGSTNFALNNAATGGALLRAAGIPGTFPVASSTGYLDIGAVQHQDSPSTNIFIIQD